MTRQTARPASATQPGAPDVAPEPNPGEPDRAELPPPQAVKDALHRFGELREYIAYFLAARADRAKLSLRRAGLLAVLGIVALFAGGAVVATAGVLACVGLAQAIAAGLNGRVWAGNLIVGCGLLLLIGVGAWLGVRAISGSWRRSMVKKYELRKTRQRADFGHDVAQRASESD